MSFFKRFLKDASQKTGALNGMASSRNVQDATDAAVRGMDLFREVAEKKNNVAFDQAKGNLFEYIEAAKFNKNAAHNGCSLRAVVTDSVGRPHDAADIEIMDGSRVVRRVQAKFSDSQHAAADSVTMQRNEKYQGMQRLIRKEEHYYDETSGETMPLIDKAKRLAGDRASRTGNIYQEQYQDVYDNLTDELHHGGVSSEGTTLDEIRKAYDSPEVFARQFERRQVITEMKTTAANMAVASMVTSGVASGISNLFAVFGEEKGLAEALADVGVDAAKSGLRGGATGALSTAIRYRGIKTGSAILSDSMAATVMAGGIIDGGVALYEYARGEINAEQLRDELIDTTAKAASTVYYTKAVTAITGTAVSPFVPMAVYTTASYVVACTREIIRNARLNEAEYNRMTALLQESTRTLNEAHQEFAAHIAECEFRQREMLEGFIDSFEYNIETGENYDQAISSIVTFANQAGITLQHVDFDDFKHAMTSRTTFRLE